MENRLFYANKEVPRKYSINLFNPSISKVIAINKQSSAFIPQEICVMIKNIMLHLAI